ncbi:uncharacterized protein CELE_F55C5.17 [Caenorhabditis elegans]|uniref:Uncharacterized protein n=1 Tax=Caenorhabditis elegans TaxID=6239 RepID=A0A2K5ATY8_CAEEL|nr:Uncharacterized protein CELE_F55C5.17 [Caenorhabditis elegans]SPC47959.1 Uncharacterized protein CELE_F55C5.17 [Caenorhabditis elegans]|eukprot:NP_001348770.1 Uncharacterized protein CELE_F55C5.17 [Caenorhabditis elegans]
MSLFTVPLRFLH